MSGRDSGITSGNQITLEQGKLYDLIEKNEADATSSFAVGLSSDSSQSDSLPLKINLSKQGKHIIGHSNYKPGRSELTISISEAESLVKTYSGKGKTIGSNKERIDFERIIGNYVDPITGDKYPTTIGIIHYSKNGTHIVPARPKEAQR